MANHTATSWGAGTPSTIQGSLGEKTHFHGFSYIGISYIMLKIDKTGVSTSKSVYIRMFLPPLASVIAARPCFCSFLLFVVEVPVNFVETAERAITLSVPRHTSG